MDVNGPKTFHFRIFYFSELVIKNNKNFIILLYIFIIFNIFSFIAFHQKKKKKLLMKYY